MVSPKYWIPEATKGWLRVPGSGCLLESSASCITRPLPYLVILILFRAQKTLFSCMNKSNTRLIQNVSQTKNRTIQFAEESTCLTSILYFAFSRLCASAKLSSRANRSSRSSTLLIRSASASQRVPGLDWDTRVLGPVGNAEDPATGKGLRHAFCVLGQEVVAREGVGPGFDGEDTLRGDCSSEGLPGKPPAFFGSG